LVQVDFHHAFRQFFNQRVPPVEVLTFPSPTETREHVECHPEVFKRDLLRETVASGHVTVQDDHGGDMQRDWGRKERNIGESNELIMDDDDIMGRDHG
jgi:hypothetical protein